MFYHKRLFSLTSFGLSLLLTVNIFAHSISHSHQQFVNHVLDDTNKINAKILQDRQKLIKLNASYDKDHRLSYSDKKWLNKLVDYYKIPSHNFSQKSTWTELNKRVDAIPASLTLAQSIQESGWGSSYLARDANNYFGEECGSRQSCYHSTDYRHFTSMYQAIDAYIHNLNTNHAYRHLRDTRYDERKHHQKIDSLNLASGLSHYSVLQGRYIASIKKLIRDYNLQKYDHIG